VAGDGAADADPFEVGGGALLAREAVVSDLPDAVDSQVVHDVGEQATVRADE